MLGSFLMGWFGVVFKGDIARVSEFLAIGLSTGYLGNLTTFSGWNAKSREAWEYKGFYLYRKKKYAEVREAWEKEYGPRRFSYKSLYKATKGFAKSGRLGRGGFGEVYKGTLPHVGYIAVTRVCHNARQGMKEFIAEVVTMGNIKHRNLVPLLGYCRRKGELLLVSEYMSNGSLDQYLFHRKKPVLTWSKRFSIMKDIASALCYLHTGANQSCVTPRYKSF